MAEADPSRCAEGARRAHIDPIGTAPRFEGVLLVEWPLPWPSDIDDIAELADVRALLRERRGDGAGLRLQLISGLRPVTPTDDRRVIAYTRRPGAFGGFQRYAAHSRLDGLADACASLIDASEAAARRPPVQDEKASVVQDLLICTHGQRDVCCGSMGMRLHQVAEQRYGERFAVWRTSHLGGHRFAPTAMTLPDGQCWAYLDEDLLDRVVTRTGELEPLRLHYRGRAGVHAPAVQAVEREAFLSRGWDWLDARWDGSFAADTEAPVLVHLAHHGADGERGAYTAEVSWDEQVELARCRLQPGPGTTDRPPIVRRLRSVSAPGS
jgi:hypothetical protein